MLVFLINFFCCWLRGPSGCFWGVIWFYKMFSFSYRFVVFLVCGPSGVFSPSFFFVLLVNVCLFYVSSWAVLYMQSQ